MGHSAIAFIIVIGILVFIHEFGHFIAARLCGVGVEVFSLGFGPKILKKRIGRTQYCLAAIPLGGYVKMVGEEPGASIDPDDENASFTHKSLWQKTIIVAAGPFFNFLLAIFIFYVLYQFSGIYLAKPIVGKVIEDSPALSAGIMPGDVIKEINKTKIESFEDISRIISAGKGEQLNIIVDRDGRFKTLILSPVLKPDKNVFGEEIEKYVIGIAGAGESFHKSLSPFAALLRSFKDTYGLIKLTLLSVGKMISGSVSADNLGGPLMIAQMAGEQAKAGIMNFAWFIALLSVNLGIINLFPIPVLDGGHLLFFGIEAATGKEVSNKLREKLVQFGAAVLVALMVFVFYNDIVRMFNGG
ncbi:MAG: RIP metalloprotease RseP [Desulfobacula sp.]|jgi:regulator of sigma E protease|uniref:RIP metalloprotease RseP n=1 Tax=Desulfobacula sp. TaxID=2593537 RepID=UPI001D3996D6|nr:RIP metalloprotease RseP [Desulfobacula sp.]MBT3484518.1 RIP metalloprotease RseP [Desulfobacula sp.]MBT3803156.1 RIP metalloprotease RseP [Desulfobacula sp.]MBT4024726.1 RIP metalloprotease RseP [Desulfobacula sp.]MBT4197204.1 RIP metalloprotease RseP [Desulfobacula sp.]